MGSIGRCLGRWSLELWGREVHWLRHRWLIVVNCTSWTPLWELLLLLELWRLLKLLLLEHWLLLLHAGVVETRLLGRGEALVLVLRGAAECWEIIVVVIVVLISSEHVWVESV